MALRHSHDRVVPLPDTPKGLFMAADVPAVPDSPVELLNKLERLVSLFTNVLIICLFLALTTLAVMQFLKPIVRSLFQRLMTYLWLKRLSDSTWVPSLRVGPAKEPSERLDPKPATWLSSAVSESSALSSVDVRPTAKETRTLFSLLASGAPSGLFPNDYFMRGVQNMAQLALGRPSQYVELFSVLTANAPDEDRITALWLDAIMHADPEAAGQLLRSSTENDGVRNAVAAVQETTKAAAEQAVDDLQLRLSGSWDLTCRAAAVLVSVILVALAGTAADVRDASALLIIGAAGGLLASLVYDSATTVFRRR